MYYVRSNSSENRNNTDVNVPHQSLLELDPVRVGRSIIDIISSGSTITDTKTKELTQSTRAVEILVVTGSSVITGSSIGSSVSIIEVTVVEIAIVEVAVIVTIVVVSTLVAVLGRSRTSLVGPFSLITIRI